MTDVKGKYGDLHIEQGKNGPGSLSMWVAFDPKQDASLITQSSQGIAISVHKLKNGKHRAFFYWNGKRITHKEARSRGIKIVWRRGRKVFQVTGKNADS
jgi:hypothetical protein